MNQCLLLVHSLGQLRIQSQSNLFRDTTMNQLALTCSTPTMEIPEQCEICSKLAIKTPERGH